MRSFGVGKQPLSQSLRVLAGELHKKVRVKLLLGYMDLYVIYCHVVRNMIYRKRRCIFLSEVVILIDQDKVTGFVCHDFVPQTNCNFEAAQN